MRYTLLWLTWAAVGLGVLELLTRSAALVLTMRGGGRTRPYRAAAQPRVWFVL